MLDHLPRHRCLIYEGDPKKQLAALAGSIHAHLRANYRCLYLNSPAMVDAIQTYLYAAGLNVTEEMLQKRLVLTSDRSHLRDGVFDMELMMRTLKATLEQALADGHAGLWASGDMSWEFGDAKDFSQLLAYEHQLEEFFKAQPAMRGVCQYHIDMLPEGVAEIGAATHPARYVNDTLSRLNPAYQGS